MNQERAILKGRLAEQKEKKTSLVAGIHANLSAVQTFLAGWRIRKIEEIDIDSAHLNLQEAARQKGELAEVREKIKTLEAELE